MIWVNNILPRMLIDRESGILRFTDEKSDKTSKKKDSTQLRIESAAS